MNFVTAQSICDGIARVFSPLAETVIHDLKSESIAYIAGNLSQRVVGDPSLFSQNEIIDTIDVVTYPKINFDGRLVKSISIPLSKRWLLCINCDVSIFNHMRELSSQLLSSEFHERPSSLFQNDWKEKVNMCVHQLIRQNNWNYEHLNGRQKKDIVMHLFKQGIFSHRGSTDYIAEVLRMGRATIFKYLKHWKGLNSEGI